MLYERTADLELPPASFAKLMTLHLVYQKLAERSISRNDVVWFGPDAYARHQQPGSSLIVLEPGQIVTVGELVCRAGDREVARFDLTAGANVEPSGLLRCILDVVRMVIGKLLGSAA